MPLFCDPGINHTVFGNYKEGSILISLASLALLKKKKKNAKREHMLLSFTRGWTVSAANIIQQSLEKFKSARIPSESPVATQSISTFPNRSQCLLSTIQLLIRVEMNNTSFFLKIILFFLDLFVTKEWTGYVKTMSKNPDTNQRHRP